MHQTALHCRVCRCLIACSPDVQARLYDELHAQGLTGTAFEAADAAALPYLANVIKEAMRVNSTVPQVNRWVQMCANVASTSALRWMYF
jgi:cytochrome P450